MPRKRKPDPPPDPPPEVVTLEFPACLAPAGSGRKAWTQDADGEGILSICIPIGAADALGGQLHLLRERAFLVRIDLAHDS